jgi:dihydroorotate dehydrogenase (NAD+) catalytic subunit
MIDLGPGHKQGVPVANPILLAGGSIGYGEAIPRGPALARLGGVVVGPIMASSRGGLPPPRVAHGLGGLVLEHGGQNRGVKGAITRYAKLWPRLGCPVVAQVADVDARGMGRMAALLAECRGIVGVELLPLTDNRDEAVQMVKAVAREADLPIWVKVRLPWTEAWAAALVDAGAHGLVVGQAMRGQLSAPTGVVEGALYGPLTFGLMLPVLRATAQLALPAALIACGGIHTPAQLEQALDAGADAVQIDSAFWVEPSLPLWLLDAWMQGQAAR